MIDVLEFGYGNRKDAAQVQIYFNAEHNLVIFSSIRYVNSMIVIDTVYLIILIIWSVLLNEKIN